ASTTAQPGMDDSRMRRRALPSVWPNPRSSGSITTLARRSFLTSTSTSRGFRNSVTEPCMESVTSRCLLRVKLDDQVFVDVREQIGAFRNRLERSLERLLVDLDPFDAADLLGDLHRVLDAQLLLRF